MTTIKNTKDKRKTKEEVWVDVVVACCSATNSTAKEVVIRWADFISEEYEKRFILTSI